MMVTGPSGVMSVPLGKGSRAQAVRQSLELRLASATDCRATASPGLAALTALTNKHDHRQRRQRDADAVFAAMAEHRLGSDHASIAHVGPSEHCGIGIQHF